MASVIIASVTYGKCTLASVIMAKVFMANETEPSSDFCYCFDKTSSMKWNLN